MPGPWLRANGSFVPPRQFEYWLDPSNPECRQYIKNFALEMVSKYKVDGLQLDYIRYPFNNKGSEMGFNWLGRQKFERETGMSLDRLDDDTRQLWVAWKVNNVSSFVKDISETLRAASRRAFAFPPQFMPCLKPYARQAPSSRNGKPGWPTVGSIRSIR